MWLKYASDISGNIQILLAFRLEKIRLEASYNTVACCHNLFFFRELLKLGSLTSLSGLQHCPPLAFSVFFALPAGLGLPKKHGHMPIFEKLKSHDLCLLSCLQNRWCHSETYAEIKRSSLCKWKVLSRCALAREGHSAPQAASHLPLNHVSITATSSSSASGGEEGKTWAETQQAAETCSAQWHRCGWEPGSWEQSHWVFVT